MKLINVTQLEVALIILGAAVCGAGLLGLVLQLSSETTGLSVSMWPIIALLGASNVVGVLLGVRKRQVGETAARDLAMTDDRSENSGATT